MTKQEEEEEKKEGLQCPICLDGYDYQTEPLLDSHLFNNHTHAQLSQMLTMMIAEQPPPEILKQLVTVGDMQRDYVAKSKIREILKRYDRMSGVEFNGWNTYEDLIHELIRLIGYERKDYYNERQRLARDKEQE